MTRRSGPPSSYPQVGGNLWREELGQIGDDLDGAIRSLRDVKKRKQPQEAMVWLLEMENALLRIQQRVSALNDYRSKDRRGQIAALVESNRELVQAVRELMEEHPNW